MQVASDQKSQPEIVEAAIQNKRRPVLGILEEFDPLQAVRAIWQRKGLVAGCAFMAALIAATVLFLIPPLYSATGYVQINPRQARVVDFEAVLSGLPADTATMETEIQVIRSRDIAQRAVKRLRLHLSPEFNPALESPNMVLVKTFAFFGLGGPEEEPNAIDPAVGESADTASAETMPPAPEGDGADAEAGSVGGFLSSLLMGGAQGAPRARAPEDIAKGELERIVSRFLSRLTVAPQGRSRVIRISFESENPQLAAEAVNTVADLYIVSQLEAKFQAAKRASAWLSERILDLRKEVDSAERKVEAFRAASGLIQGGRDATLTAEQVTELNAQYVLERTRLAEAEARLRQVRTAANSENGLETVSEVLSSPVIRDLRQEEGRAGRLVAELSEEYGERHPRLINARAELRDIRNKIDIEVRKIIQGLENEVGIARARTASLRGALANMREEVAELNTAEVQLRSLERDAEASRNLLETLLARSKETSSQEAFQQPDASVISPATPPKGESSPNKILILGLAVVAGSLLGAVLAVLFEQLDLGFRSSDEVERALGMSGLGLIPKLHGVTGLTKSPPDMIIEKPRSSYAEAVRSLHTNLMLADITARPKIVLLASALPNEGKTSLALSLARLMASYGQKVLVIDCDLRKPSIHSGLALKESIGLCDCLEGRAALEDVIIKDPKSSAQVIQAGTKPANPPDLLDSIALQKLLNRLSSKYDLVIIDSAPVLAVSDTLFLSRLADKTIMVVRWASTRRKDVALAVKRLRDAHCDVAGAALSMVDAKKHARYGSPDSGVFHYELKKYYAS